MDFISKVDAAIHACENGFAEPALALALTLPDICAQIEYPNMVQVGNRYKLWSNEHIDLCHDDTGNQIKFSGNILYLLRCHFLHSGDGTVDITDNSTRFCLMDVNPEIPTKGLMIRVSTFANGSHMFTINLYQLIDSICSAAREFYDSWPQKNDFDEHTIDLLNYEDE